MRWRHHVSPNPRPLAHSHFCRIRSRRFYETIKDILSEPTEIRETKLESKDFDEKNFLANELTELVKQEFGGEIQVFAEDDDNIYDPEGKARHARPFKPAILIE